MRPDQPTLPSPQKAGHLVKNQLRNLEPKWWVLIAVGSGTFMSALDISVVNTVLPVVKDGFQSQIATVEWVVIVYLLMVSGLLPIFGRLGDLRGHKRIYLAGFIVFIASSMFCGLAPNLPILIAGRAFQALGAAMLSANSPAILTKSFPASQRGQALGLQATMTYLGLTVGPSLGGWLTGLISWRAAFFINLPVGLLALALSARHIRSDKPSTNNEPFDWRGAFLFMTGLILLLLALNQGHNWGWSSPLTLGILTVALFALGLFLAIERKIQAPLLDLRLFRSRLFSASVLSAVFNYICVYSILFLLPFYLIEGRSLSPATAGLLLTSQPLVMAVAAPLSGTLSDRLGTRAPSTLGMVILAIGLALLARLGPVSSNLNIISALAVSGLGIGIFISPNTSALLGSAPRTRQGIAAGILATSRNVGMVLGVGFSGAIFTTVITHASLPPQDALFAATRTSLWAAAGVALLGVVTSAARGLPDE